jgi:hypothetical protein
MPACPNYNAEVSLAGDIATCRTLHPSSHILPVSAFTPVVHSQVPVLVTSNMSGLC